MDENRIEERCETSAAKCRKASVALPGMFGHAEGLANHAAGTAQDVYGQAADTARRQATNFDRWLRHNIETLPYTCALIALGIG